MRIAVCGIGSLWTVRAPTKGELRRNHRPTYYNSTAVQTVAGLRSRSAIYGVVRFDGAAAINPHEPVSVVGRIFDGSEMREDRGLRRQVTIRHPVQGEPEVYIISLQSARLGWVERAGLWRSAGVEVISFSESERDQEALLLVNPYSWVRTMRGIYFIERPLLRAQLRAGILRENRG